MPPYNSVLGHLPILKSVTDNLPPNVHGHYLPAALRQEILSLGPIFYVDGYPFSTPVLVVSSPHGAYQITQEHSLPKYAGLRSFLYPLTGGNDLVTMEKDVWKHWRGIFNPGFSAGHLMTLVPGIMKDVLTFREILREHAERNELFQLDLITLKLTVDVIGRVTLWVAPVKIFIHLGS